MVEEGEEFHQGMNLRNPHFVISANGQPKTHYPLVITITISRSFLEEKNQKVSGNLLAKGYYFYFGVQKSESSARKGLETWSP